MGEFAIVAGALKLLYAVAAIVMVWLLLRRFDRSCGFKFTDTLAKIRESSTATATYYGARIVAVCILFGMLMGCTAQAAPVFPDKYDGKIRHAVAAWWPDYPAWTAWKAQLWQESRLDPAAVSPVGAAGLAQFMPGTWAQVSRELRIGEASPHHDIAISAGAYYMAKLRRQWSSPRPEDDRHRLAQASYNAGLGHILAAQRRCGNARHYPDIIACLPAITGHHSRETIGYVDRIARWRAMISAGL